MPVKAPVYKADTFAGRWYVEGRLGGPLLKSYNVDIGGGIGPGSYKASSGLSGAVDLGYQFTPNWRAEVEFTATEARDGNVQLGAVNLPHTGRTNVYTFGLNGFYSFDLNPMFRPFLGAGVGFATYKVSNLGAVGGAFVLNDTKTTGVGALHAGFDIPFGRQFALTARYSLAYTGSMTFGSVPVGNATTRSSAYDNVFTGGLRYYLN